MSPPRDPSDRDDQAAIVDRLLKQLPHADPTLRGDPPAARRAPRPMGPRPGPPPPPPPNIRGAWWRAMLGVLLAGAVPFWPYANGCGFPLAAYLAALSAVLLVGLWTAGFAWREHAGLPHVLALLVTGWSGVLAAERVLPRIGYAGAQATWACIAEPAPADQPASLVPIVVTDTSIAFDSTAADSGEISDSAR